MLLTGALLVAPTVCAQGEISAAARQHFQAGVNLMQDPDGARYEEAYREFAAAYQASPSWKILGNLGIAAMKLERDGEAIDAYQKYLAGGGTSLAPEEREQFQRDLTTLQAGVVRLNIDVNEPGVTILDERTPVAGSPVRNTYSVAGTHLEIGVRSGHHKITASAAGFADAVWELEGVSGAAQTHAFALQHASAVVAGSAAPGGESTAPPSAGERPTPTGVYVGIAVTGAFAVGAGVMGALALGKKSDFDKANDGSDAAHADTLHGNVKTFNLVTDILIGAAVVSAGVVTYLYVSRPTKESPPAAYLRVRPQAGSNSGSLMLEGAF
jgi:hypothetical protein